MQSITFVIPHFQDLASLERLLASIERERVGSSDSPVRAIVVDDATPGARAELERFESSHPWLRLIVNPENRGPAHSRNTGTDEANSEWVWFLDSDVALQPGALQNMQAVLDRRRDAFAIVSGVGLRTDARNGFQRYKNYLEHSWQPPDGETFTVDSKSFLVRRQDFLDVGGFDTQFRHPTVEDYDLGYRLLKSGCKLYYTQQVKVFHEHPRFWRQWRDFYRRTKGWVELKSTYGFSFDDNGTSPKQALLQVVNALIILSVMSAVFAPMALVFSALMVIVWIGLNTTLHATMIEGGESIAFLVRGFFYSCLLSIPIWCGFAVGSVRLWLRRA